MRKKEIISIVEYFYHKQARYEDAVRTCSYRYIRRDLDSIDLLEEILAKERLKTLEEISREVLHILNLTETDEI